MIFLDTNVISEIQKQNVDPNVEAWFDRQSLESLWLTTIVVSELRYGAALLDPSKKRTAFEKLIGAYVDGLFAGRIATFDLSSTTLFAAHAAEAKRSGREVKGFADAAIAAIALSKGFAVATRDVRAFRDMGVEVINPWDQN